MEPLPLSWIKRQTWQESLQLTNTQTKCSHLRLDQRGFKYFSMFPCVSSLCCCLSVNWCQIGAKAARNYLFIYLFWRLAHHLLSSGPAVPCAIRWQVFEQIFKCAHVPQASNTSLMWKKIMRAAGKASLVFHVVYALRNTVPVLRSF